MVKKTKAKFEYQLNRILKQPRQRNYRFSKALKGSELGVIAEVKRRSPSKGEFQKIEDPAALALQYCHGGVSAISVLTDEQHFGGSIQDLTQVAASVSVPCIRKDFILHPLQLAEAVLAGASAVLLIASALGNDLKYLIDQTHELGLEALVEVHDLAGLELSLKANAPIIGINHRNLDTFEMDMKISEVLRPLIPPHVIAVAESGMHSAEQARRMRDLGYDAILIGEALALSKDPAELIRQMRRG